MRVGGLLDEGGGGDHGDEVAEEVGLLLEELRRVVAHRPLQPRRTVPRHPVPAPPPRLVNSPHGTAPLSVGARTRPQTATAAQGGPTSPQQSAAAAERHGSRAPWQRPARAGRDPGPANRPAHGPVRNRPLVRSNGRAGLSGGLVRTRHAAVMP